MLNRRPRTAVSDCVKRLPTLCMCKSPPRPLALQNRKVASLDLWCAFPVPMSVHGAGSGSTYHRPVVLSPRVRDGRLEHRPHREFRRIFAGEGVAQCSHYIRRIERWRRRQFAFSVENAAALFYNRAPRFLVSAPAGVLSKSFQTIGIATDVMHHRR